MNKVILEMEKIKHPYSGLGQWCLHLGNELLKIDQNTIDYSFYMPQDKLSLFEREPHFHKVNQIHRKLSFLLPKADIWHSIHQDSPYMPSSKKTKYVLTIHDLNFLYENKSPSEVRKYLSRLQKQIDRADIIAAISHFAKVDVLKNLEIPAHKNIQVIYNGLALKAPENILEPQFRPKKKFLYSIGAILEKKNFHTLVPFLDKIKDEYSFILAGNKNTSYGNKVEKLIREHNLQDHFFMVGEISDNDRYWYYKNCSAFIFPSKVEGFGLPIIEAMSLGRPVFTTKFTSIPEVAGPHAFYFGSFDAEHMVKVFQEEMANIGPELEKQLIDWTKQFSWKNAANSYHQLFSSLL